MKSSYKLIGAALLASVLFSTDAKAVGPFTMNFDSQADGTNANLFAPVGLSIVYGVYEPDLDIEGDPIPGSESWREDITAPAVLVQEPQSFYGRGLAPSIPNALDAVFQPVLLLFDTPFDLTSFSITLDNDTFGTNESVLFYDNANTLVHSAPVDQTVAGVQVNVGAIGSVSKVVLPSGALYDNVSAVPEPSSALLLLSGLAAGLMRRGRRA